MLTIKLADLYPKQFVLIAYNEEQEKAFEKLLKRWKRLTRQSGNLKRQVLL